MSNHLNDFFCCKESEETWIFSVGVVGWEGQIPQINWKPFRHWKTEPDAERIQKAREAAMKQPRFFRTCDRCKKLNNAGHMHDSQTCQSCAERFLGVIY